MFYHPSDNIYSALYEMFSASETDIVLKTDREGFIRDASPALKQLGFAVCDMLIGPNILDLADDPFKPAIRAAHDLAMQGGQPGRWIEFQSSSVDGRGRWFAIRIGSLADDTGAICGAVAVIRNMEEVASLKEQLFRSELTDPLTGLSNRRAFLLMLEYLLESRAGGWLVLLEIDFFKALNLRYGMATGDRILTAYADLLRCLTDADAIISRVGAHRFGILLPGLPQERARALCSRIVSRIRQIGHFDASSRLPLTASAGAAPIRATPDETLKPAELALFLAKAKGGGSVEMAST